MNLAQLKALVGQAKTSQAANQSNPNLSLFVGMTFIASGMKITKDVFIQGLGTKCDKITFTLHEDFPLTHPKEHTHVFALDSFHQAATTNAEELAPILGEVFPAPMQFRIVGKTGKKREKDYFYAEFIGLYEDEAHPLPINDEPPTDPTPAETPLAEEPPAADAHEENS